MGWITLCARRTELKHNKNMHEFEKLQIQNSLTKLSSFANALGDGFVDPEEITSLGRDLFGDALDFNKMASAAATETASEKSDRYETMYQDVTQEQYYNNPALAAQASLYFDESGNLDTQTMFNNFYKEDLLDFVQEYYMPILNEKQEELERQKTELETLTTAEEAELQQLDQKISEEIQSSVIKL